MILYIHKKEVGKMLKQLIDALDSDDYETIKLILDKMEKENNN